MRVGDLEEELQDDPPTQEDLYENYVIFDARGGGYVVRYEDKQLGTFEDEDEALRAIGINMKKEDYWPSIYKVNDHGNIDELDTAGNSINGWV